MKKGISISLALLLLTAMLQLSVATHYCGGEAAATKVTLSGKTASCGIEDENENPVHGALLKSHCCDDVITSYAIDSKYVPSFSFIMKLYQYNSQVFSKTFELTMHSPALSQAIWTSEKSPGLLMSTKVDLSEICVYRI